MSLSYWRQLPLSWRKCYRRDRMLSLVRLFDTLTYFEQQYCPNSVKTSFRLLSVLEVNCHIIRNIPMEV